MYAIGDNTYGEIGIEDNISYEKVNQINFFSNLNTAKISKIATGSRSSLVLMDDGTLYTFGDNSDSQCTGLATMYPTPKKIAEELKGKIIDIFCGYNHCTIIMGKENKYKLYLIIYIILDNGDMYSWGDNSYGKLTLMEMTQNINYPRILQILKGKYVTEIALGYYMTIIGTSSYENSIIKINRDIEEKNNNKKIRE